MNFEEAKQQSIEKWKLIVKDPGRSPMGDCGFCELYYYVNYNCSTCPVNDVCSRGRTKNLFWDTVDAYHSRIWSGDQYVSLAKQILKRIRAVKPKEGIITFLKRIFGRIP